MTQLRAVWEGEPVAHAAFKAETADGILYDAESVLAAPLIDGQPDFSRAVFTIIDVTPHREEKGGCRRRSRRRTGSWHR